MNNVVEVLKRSYFELASQEDFPNTPKITKQLDDLEQGIEQLTGKKLERCSDNNSTPRKSKKKTSIPIE